jgi:hypothetical protein
MAIFRFIFSLAFAFVCSNALASTPTVGAPLPLLNITERGEIVMNGDDFAFVPWRSDIGPGKAHVIQYFGATMGDRDLFEPFTDLLQANLEPGSYHVTTILNLDAAMWGTTGLVISELEKNKRLHPQATMVVDNEGLGVKEWNLGKAGTGIIVLDDKGIVQYFSLGAPTEKEMASALELMRATINN